METHRSPKPYAGHSPNQINETLYNIQIYTALRRRGFLRIFQGIASRGVVDGIMAREFTRIRRGIYEPLLLAPKDWQAIHNLVLSASKNLAGKYGYLSRLVMLIVDDERLRSSP